MTATPRHTRQAQEASGQQARADHPPQKKAGHPKGAPSTIVNLRIPVALLVQLDAISTGLRSRLDLKRIEA